MVMRVRTPEAWGDGDWTGRRYMADYHRPDRSEPPRPKKPRKVRDKRATTGAKRTMPPPPSPVDVGEDAEEVA